MLASMRAAPLLLAGLAAAAVVTAFALPPIPQDPRYHDFADRRAFLGVPSFLNVVSNLPFVAVGAWGLAVALGRRGRAAFREPWERRTYALFFAAVLLTGVGSAAYHARPDYDSLFWDRLPMTLLFASILGILLVERVDPRLGARALPILAAAGVASLLYGQACDDFRFYGALQGLGIAAVPAHLLLFPPRYTRAGDFWWVAALYGAAKVAETFDEEIFLALGRAVSGHTLKHLLAAAAGWVLAEMLRRRRPLGGGFPGGA